jgi:hypothetical protein
MSVQPPAIFTPPRADHSRHTIAISLLLIMVVVLAVFLGLAYSSNGFLPFGRPGAPRIVPPSNSSLTAPPSSTPPPNDPSWIVLWNSCGGSVNSCPMNSTGWREGGVPDTFDYSVSFDSTIPVTVYFLTLPQYMQFSYCSGKIFCVSGSYNQTRPSVSVQNFVFKLAEGCADYVAIYQSSANGNMSPNIRIARNPYSAPTGICRITG